MNKRSGRRGSGSPRLDDNESPGIQNRRAGCLKYGSQWQPEMSREGTRKHPQKVILKSNPRRKQGGIPAGMRMTWRGVKGAQEKSCARASGAGSGEGDAVAAILLGGVHCLVGAVDELFESHRIGKLGKADAEG